MTEQDCIQATLTRMRGLDAKGRVAQARLEREVEEPRDEFTEAVAKELLLMREAVRAHYALDMAVGRHLFVGDEAYKVENLTNWATHTNCAAMGVPTTCLAFSVDITFGYGLADNMRTLVAEVLGDD